MRAVLQRVLGQTVLGLSLCFFSSGLFAEADTTSPDPDARNLNEAITLYNDGIEPHTEDLRGWHAGYALRTGDRRESSILVSSEDGLSDQVRVLMINKTGDAVLDYYHTLNESKIASLKHTFAHRIRTNLWSLAQVEDRALVSRAVNENSQIFIYRARLTLDGRLVVLVMDNGNLVYAAGVYKKIVYPAEPVSNEPSRLLGAFKYPGGFARLELEVTDTRPLKKFIVSVPRFCNIDTFEVLEGGVLIEGAYHRIENLAQGRHFEFALGEPTSVQKLQLTLNGAHEAGCDLLVYTYY